MSLPLTPYERWEEGTTQNDVPANNNSLRSEIFNTDGIADDVTAQPGSPADSDWYIIPPGATGAQWATFAENSVAIFYGGTWYEFVPSEGDKVTVAAAQLIYDGSSGWVPYGSNDAVDSVNGQTGVVVLDAADVGAAARAYTIVTEASPYTADPGTHDGLNTYVRAGGDVTFDNAEPYTAGMTFPIRATAAISLIEDGVTLTPPYGGTHDLEEGMAVQVVMTGATTGDIIGQTVASS